MTRARLGKRGRKEQGTVKDSASPLSPQGLSFFCRTSSVNVAFVVKLQLSVARIVIVWNPLGVALLTETTPAEFTEIVPV